MFNGRRTIGFIALLLTGCGGGAASFIAESPENWSQYADRDVTLRGSAGNSGQGPLVRFDDGGYIGLRTRAPWSPAEIGKPIEVAGRVVSGKGFRAEPYVLEMKSARLLAPEEVPERSRKVAR
ncbi:MAG TPA: hypothetical protein VF595_15530 [Tepidisphaeraceae bacterium]